MKQPRKYGQKEKQRMDVLKRLAGVDLCACAGGHQLKCSGICRERHTDQTGQVRCVALYRINIAEINKNQNNRRRNENNHDPNEKQKRWKRLKKNSQTN